MLLHLVETLQMDHSSRANLKGGEGNIMMVVLTQVEILSSFPFSSLFKESVEADGELNYHCSFLVFIPPDNVWSEVCAGKVAWY